MFFRATSIILLVLILLFLAKIAWNMRDGQSLVLVFGNFKPNVISEEKQVVKYQQQSDFNPIFGYGPRVGI